MIDLGFRVALCACLAAMFGGAVLAFGSHERDVGRAEVRAAWAADTEARQRAVIADQAAAAAETKRRIDAMQEIVRDATTQKDAAMADAGSARSERDRLRQQQARYLASVRASLSAGGAASAPGSQATGVALDLFSDLFSESDEGAGILAAALDSARAAGLACERAYDALTGPN